MIKGQGGDDHFFAFHQLGFHPFAALHHVGANVAVREHRAFGNACCAACVLQKSKVVAGKRNGLKGLCCALL